MNTLKEITVKILMSSIFSVLTAIVSMPSLAQPFASDPLQASPSATMPEHASSVAYKNTVTGNKLADTLSLDQASGFGEETNMSPKVKVFRVKDMCLTNFRSNMFVKDDLASFTINAPTSRVNGALSVVGTVSQISLDDSLTKLAQVLSLMATRKINAELAYAAKIDKASRFDSVIAYKLHSNSDSGKPEVVASVKYGIRF